jgi:hypothetical protein
MAPRRNSAHLRTKRHRWEKNRASMTSAFHSGAPQGISLVALKTFYNLTKCFHNSFFFFLI